jgi:hypothetical protein
VTWPGSSRPSLQRVRQAYSDRLSYPEAATLIGKLLAQWPRAPQDEPYMLALATALLAYPRCVAMAAIEPTTGVASEKTFGLGPTVADVVAWCDRESAWMRRIVERQNLHHDRAKDRAHAIADQRRTQEARKLRPDLEELRRRHGPGWGLSTGEVFTSTDAPSRKERQRVDRKIIAEYERIGQKPVYASSGMLISPGLLEIMQRKLGPENKDDDWGP